MLLNNFFYILTAQTNQQTITATLQINQTHDIFGGHFPGQPVVPGVCMMQMVKEVLEKEINQKLTLKTADHLKFLTVLDPTINKEIQAEIKSEPIAEGYKVIASLFIGDIIFFKLKGIFLAAG